MRAFLNDKRELYRCGQVGLCGIVSAQLTRNDLAEREQDHSA